MNYKYEKVGCNLCDSNEQHHVSDKGQHDIPLSLVICKNCGLGYLNPRWDANGYLDFYKKHYDLYYRANIKSGSLKDEPNENSIVKRFRERGLLSLDAKNILDIGSGTGDNIMAFSKLFPQAKLYAIEPSESSQKILFDRNIQVLSNDVNSHWDDGMNQKFDLIIMRHVLEHFLDPLTVVRRIKEVLSPEGILYIAVPNNLNPTQNLEKSWFRVVHTYYFNKYSLKKLLDLSGLKLLDLVVGDESNDGEVFLMAKVSEKMTKPTFSKEHYEIQKRVFEEKLKEQERLGYKIKEGVRKVKNRILP